MNKYKSIEFSVFKNGEIQKKYSELENMAYSNKLAINDYGKVELAKLFVKNDIADTYTYATNSKIGGRYGATYYFYFFLVKQISGKDHAVLYKCNLGNAPTLVKDFGAGLPDQIILHKDRIIVQFENDTTGDLEWYQTTSPTGTWTAIPELKNHSMNDWEILNDEIYITILTGYASTGKSNIYISRDNGITFSLLFTQAPVQSLYVANGFLYGKSGDMYVMENETWRLVEKNVKGSVHIVDEKLKAIDYHNIYIFNGDKFEIERTFEENKYLSFEGVSKYKTFFSIRSDAEGGLSNYSLYSYDTRGVLIKEKEFLNKDADWGIFGVFFVIDTTYIITKNETNLITEIWNDYNPKYVDNGYFQTTIIDKGEIVPKQLILRHDPLLTGSTVKVYTKKDQASSWENAIITSNTVGGIKKKYNYPAGAIHDFTEFKVELITTDTTKTPKNIKLEFLYLPIGLENAK